MDCFQIQNLSRPLLESNFTVPGFLSSWLTELRVHKLLILSSMTLNSYFIKFPRIGKSNRNPQCMTTWDILNSFGSKNHYLELNVKEVPTRNEIPVAPKQRMAETGNFLGLHFHEGALPHHRGQLQRPHQHPALCQSSVLPHGGRASLSPPANSTGQQDNCTEFCPSTEICA